MDLTGNTLSHANTCEGGNTPEVLLVMETTTSYHVEIGRDGTVYVPDPDGRSFDGSMSIADHISCADCGSHRAFTNPPTQQPNRYGLAPPLDGHHSIQIKWGKHAPTLEATIIKAMTAQQPNTPVNMRMVERLASEIQASWLMQPTMQEQELQEEGR